MAAEAGQSFVVLSELGENQCVVFGRNSLQGGEAEAVKVPEVVFVPAGETTKVRRGPFSMYIVRQRTPLTISSPHPRY